MNKLFQKLIFGALVLVLVFSFSFAAAAGSASVTFNLKADLKKVESDGLVIDITKISVPFSFFFIGEKKRLADELEAIPTPLVNFKVNKSIISKIIAQGHSDNFILSALGTEINFSEVTMADEIKDIRGKYHSDKSFSDILFWLKRDSQKFEINGGSVTNKINMNVTIQSPQVKEVDCWNDGGLLIAFNQVTIESSKIKKILRNSKTANFNDIKKGDKVKKITGQCFRDGDYEISEFSVLDSSLPDNYCRGAEKTQEDCGDIRSWSCVNNQCRVARCGDGICNDDGFSPAAESASCSQDCGDGSAGNGSSNDGSDGDSGSSRSNNCTNITNNIAITKESYTGDLDANNDGTGYPEADNICSTECGSSYHACTHSELSSLQGVSCSGFPQTAWLINHKRNDGSYDEIWTCSNWSSGNDSKYGHVASCFEGHWSYINDSKGDSVRSCNEQHPFFCCSDSGNDSNDGGSASSCTSASSCGGSSQWSCINGKCQAARCGDGFCNDCSDSFSPCVPSETHENCSQDCKEKTVKQDNRDYSIKGYTVGYKAFWDIDESNKDQGIDYCTTIKDGSVGSHKVDSSPYLVEFYKDAQGFAAFEVVKCENGCKDGACQ